MSALFINTETKSVAGIRWDTGLGAPTVMDYDPDHNHIQTIMCVIVAS
jgi:hypothetical protein